MVLEATRNCWGEVR